MKDMQRKCSFIDWRDKIEELCVKLLKEERITLDQLATLLEEGSDKDFLVKQGTNKNYFFKPTERSETDPTIALFHNFGALHKVIETFNEAQSFDKDLKVALKCFKNDKSSSESSVTSPRHLTE